MNFYPYFWKLAKQFDPESIHHFSLNFLHAFPDIAALWKSLPMKTIKGFHITWSNPIGIAAGLDKNAIALNFWNKIGLGCIEVGTVTPRGQYGNERPRIFRLPNESLRNAMGFPNEGSEIIYKRISTYKALYKTPNSTMPIWVNLGKQKDTEILHATKDYVTLIHKFSSLADALVINISSPNTPNLRQLQNEQYLENLLATLSIARNSVNINCPLVLKVSPDESSSFYERLPRLLNKHQWQGVIATNTTAQHTFGAGGLSGKDLFEKSYSVAKILAPACIDSQLDFIYAGGLNNQQQINDLKKIGVRFFQLYSSFIYHGPSILEDLS